MRLLATRIIAFFFMMVSFSLNLGAQTTTVESYPKMVTMTEVQQTIIDALKQNAPHEILVVFDVDSTLIMSKEAALQRGNIHKYNSTLRSLMKDISPDQRVTMLNLCTHYESALVDVDAPKIISALQKKGIKIIACTAASPGQFKNVARAEVARFETLKGHRIDFSQAFPDYSDLTFTNIRAFQDRHPILYQGVLCSAGTKAKPGKGAAIVELLRIAKYMPKVIIFIDDSKDYLTDLHTVLKREFPKIQFKGIEFTGEMSYPARAITEAEFIQFWKNLANEAKALPSAPAA